MIMKDRHNLAIEIERLRKSIRISSGCEYLYSRFDSLVDMLVGEPKLSEAEMAMLYELIRDYAVESRFDNYTSANFMKYSARCFYCADYLAQYLGGIYAESAKNALNRYFLELVDSRVAPIIQQEVLDKYIQLYASSFKSPKNVYERLVSKAIDECGNCRYWQPDDISLAWLYTQSAYRILMDYVKIYLDKSVLKDWVPLFNTAALARFWYKYPDSCNYAHTRQRTRQFIGETLDKMLDKHLKLFSFWYWYSPQELVDAYSLDDLIDVLEVEEEEEFEKILKHMVTLPYNVKVKKILEHFEQDDEQVVVELSRRLLAKYVGTV